MPNCRPRRRIGYASSRNRQPAKLTEKQAFIIGLCAPSATMAERYAGCQLSDWTQVSAAS
jgi:hypothetical protein